MKQRELSYDLMRIVAIIAVIIIHVSATNWYHTSIDNYWLINNFVNALFHSWAVPLFLMVSGALLLNKEITIKKVFLKYIPRVLICLIIWHFIYYFYTNKVFNINSLIEATKKLISGESYSHLWYLYMIIGIYMLLPILSKLVKSLNKNELGYFLIIVLIIAIVIPTIKLLFDFDLTKFIVPYKVLQFNEYIFYFILGYYINNFDVKNKKVLIILIIIFLLTNIGVACFSNNMAIKNNDFINYANTYTVFGVINTICLFMFIKSFFSNKNNKVISSLGNLSFGVYLIHFLIIKILQNHGIHTNIINPVLGNILVTVLVLVISYFIVFIISKIPIMKKTIGL